MKKILLFLMTICAFVIVKAQTSSTCGTGVIYHWTDATPNSTTGEQGAITAPILINGSSTDWQQFIVGLFNYASSPKGGFENDPYTSPIAAANVQKDGLKDATGANYDRDVPGQGHRDLRYFAFTYDQKNVYFIFRRPENNTAQVKLYYFIDIDVDGYMKTGEPVIQISFNNSGSSIIMGYYQAVNSNGTAAGSYDAVKGNIMSTPAGVSRAKNAPNTSQWEPGAADGWSMPGDFIALSSSLLPVAVSGETFAAETLTDAHPDGTVSGYGVEFAVPWKYIRMYNAQGPVPATNPLNYHNVFTWHVSLVGGNSGVSGAEDNAGGCCSGLAVSGAPDVTSNGLFTSPSPYVYRVNLTYTEHRNLNTKITTGQIDIVNPVDGNGNPLASSAVQAWQLTGNVDADCNPATAGASTSFTFVNTFTQGTDVHYVFAPSNFANASVIAPANSTGCYYIDINTVFGGLPPLKVTTVNYAFTTEFDIQSNSCNTISNGGSTGGLEVLPVKLISFNATRSGQNVNLTWQTATEQNNTGFEIQRLMSAGGWQDVGFVSTKAVNGNSNAALNYQFTDINTTKGVTQYRLKQVDKDNHSAYSVIRSVRGDGQKANTIIYPNPSGDGKVNIVFDDANSPRDVSLIDVSGKTLKQWKGVTNNNIRIDNLNSGFYTVRIVNIETGEQSIEKFIVNKR